jgi:hypothetical protein
VGTTLALVAGLTAVLVLTVRFGGYRTDPVGLAWWYAVAVLTGTIVRRISGRS